MRLCQNVGTTSFIFYSSAIFSFGYAALKERIQQINNLIIKKPALSGTLFVSA